MCAMDDGLAESSGSALPISTDLFLCNMDTSTSMSCPQEIQLITLSESPEQYYTTTPTVSQHFFSDEVEENPEHQFVEYVYTLTPSDPEPAQDRDETDSLFYAKGNIFVVTEDHERVVDEMSQGNQLTLQQDDEDSPVFEHEEDELMEEEHEVEFDQLGVEEVVGQVGGEECTNVLQEYGYIFVNEDGLEDGEEEEGVNGSDVDIESLCELVEALKCKLCHFTTLHRELLLDHHRNIHTPQDDVTPAMWEGDETVRYLCGQCCVELPTLPACRQHMILEHHLTPHTFNGAENDGEGQSEEGDQNPAKEVSESTSTPLTGTKGEGDNVKLQCVEGALRDYWLQHHTPRDVRLRLCSDRKVRCSLRRCLFRFSNVDKMEQHSKCHTASQLTLTSLQSTFTCFKCNEGFVTWPQCSVHLGKEHSINLDLLTCPLCAAHTTHSVAKMVRHLSKHVEQAGGRDGEAEGEAAQRWYTHKKCQICHKIYANSKSLKKHSQAVHHKLKPFKCNVCGHSSATKNMLLLHTRQHTGEKLYQCEYCPYKTSDHNTRDKHRRRHTGVYPYKCKLCPYGSIQSGALRSHIKNRHPDSLISSSTTSSSTNDTHIISDSTVKSSSQQDVHSQDK